ncbi:hypothetical protein TorRG33x02_182780, partial [Trema orientale]
MDEINKVVLSPFWPILVLVYNELRAFYVLYKWVPRRFLRKQRTQNHIAIDTLYIGPEGGDGTGDETRSSEGDEEGAGGGDEPWQGEGGEEGAGGGGGSSGLAGQVGECGVDLPGMEGEGGNCVVDKL